MSTLYELPFAPDWVTCGYSHGAGNKWIEVGASASVHSDPPPNPPELGLHEVADKLNALEAEIARLREALTGITTEIVKSTDLAVRMVEAKAWASCALNLSLSMNRINGIAVQALAEPEGKP